MKGKCWNGFSIYIFSKKKTNSKLTEMAQNYVTISHKLAKWVAWPRAIKIPFSYDCSTSIRLSYSLYKNGIFTIYYKLYITVLFEYSKGVSNSNKLMYKWYGMKMRNYQRYNRVVTSSFERYYYLTYSAFSHHFAFPFDAIKPPTTTSRNFSKHFDFGVLNKVVIIWEIEKIIRAVVDIDKVEEGISIYVKCQLIWPCYTHM